MCYFYSEKYLTISVLFQLVGGTETENIAFGSMKDVNVVNSETFLYHHWTFVSVRATPHAAPASNLQNNTSNMNTCTLFKLITLLILMIPNYSQNKRDEDKLSVLQWAVQDTSIYIHGDRVWTRLCNNI